LNKWDDGLIGYYKQNQSGTDYDLSTFYTEGASKTSQSGVVQPAPTNLLLTPTPKVGITEPPVMSQFTQKVLMLIDPRASVHATTGILPVKAITIPSDQCDDVLSTLEMSFLITPVLCGSGGLALPIPSENGYQFSWVEEEKDNAGTVWSVTPEILSSSGKAIWSYTPQTITEGWLRMNPVLLEFDLLNSGQQPVVSKAAPNSLTLKVSNKKQRAITFNAGEAYAEGDGNENTGSVFYIHFGDLVSQADIPQIHLGGAGWTFKMFTSEKYGAYWAATPDQTVSLPNGESISFTVANLIVATGAAQAQVYFDYYYIDGLNDGVFAELMTVVAK
jgi:hypothetical protein